MATRNRTIRLTSDDRKALPAHLCRLNSHAQKEEITDSIICQDIMETLPLLPPAMADLIIIDPPYNLTKDFNGLTFHATSDDSYREYLKSWLPAVMPLLKPSGSIYVCCDWKCSHLVREVLERYAVIKNRITWQREKGRGAQANWKNAMEDIWFAVADEKNYYFDVGSVKQKRRVHAPYKSNGIPKDWEETPDGNFRLTHPSNLWDDISVPYWSMPENTDHPTQKPEKLFAKLILASCPEGGLVFDPFLGSGTSAVVAKKLGRHYCGVEINEEYAMLAAKRIIAAEKDTRIQGYEDGVFWERNTLNTMKKREG